VSSGAADVLIIGAGVSGLSIALHLRVLGVPNVTVLERHHVGAGQSGRAAGIIRALVNNTAVASILMESLGFFQSFNERFGEHIPVMQPGYLLIDHEGHAETMNEAIRNASAAGCEAKRVSSAEAGAMQPGLVQHRDDIYAFEPAAIHLDAMLTTQALARAARRMGVKIEQGCEVRNIVSDASRVRGVETSGGRLIADTVVMTTSVLGAAQLREAGIEVPVFPHRTEMAFFSVFPRSPHRLLRILSDARTLLYLRPEGSDQMFVGWREGDRVSSPEDFAVVDPENYRQTAHYASLADMQRRLIEMLPFMADGFVHRTYACVYDYTADGMPILDEAETLRGLYFALGFSGGGFSLSPWVGSVMARFLAEGVKPPEMRLFRLARFQEGQLLSWSNTAKGGRGD
jgi:sarcosine oxidase subunit beta